MQDKPISATLAAGSSNHAWAIGLEERIKGYHTDALHFQRARVGDESLAARIIERELRLRASDAEAAWEQNTEARNR